MITNNQLQKTLDELDYIKKYYNKHFAIEKKPFSKEYDKKLRSEFKAIILRINIDVDKAAELLTFEQKMGRPVKDRVLLTKLHLFQVLFQFTNREMESFSLMFILTGDDSFSYKTIERAFEDPIVAAILHNLFVLSAGKPRKVKASGDGTGISLTISKHYRTEREKDLKEKKDSSKRKDYLFSVAILDLDSNLYVGYASGFKSEKKLFKEAVQMAKKLGFEFETICLDKYYSYQSIFKYFNKETKIIVLPKKNSTIHGPKKWKQLLKEFITDTLRFLKQYYQRTKSESNFSKDKRKFGQIKQRKKQRIITAQFSRTIIRNFSMKHLYG